MSIEKGTRVIVVIGGAGHFIECEVVICTDEIGHVYELVTVGVKFIPPTNGGKKKRSRKQERLSIRLHPSTCVRAADDIRRYSQWCYASAHTRKRAKEIGGLAHV